MNIKANWQSWLKVGAILVAVVAWAITANATLERHVLDQKDAVKLLMLICQNTAPSPVAKIDCYKALEKP